MTTDPIVIVGMSRTPMGAFQGDFAAIQAPELGAVAIKGAIDEAKINPKNIPKNTASPPEIGISGLFSLC